MSKQNKASKNDLSKKFILLTEEELGSKKAKIEENRKVISKPSMCQFYI